MGERLKRRRTSVWVTGNSLPVRMKNGTPSQRQLSTSSRRAANVSVVESGATPGIARYPLDLAAHVFAGIGALHRLKGAEDRVLDHARVAAGGRLHGDGRDELHQVVDDNVAECADRVVEVAARLHPEALGHRDLHRLDVVAVP